MYELILGGQRSGKSGYAEQLALDWLAQDTQHQVHFLVTAYVPEEDLAMQQRIAHHQAVRAQKLPTAQVHEVWQKSSALAETIFQVNNPHHLMVVDCLTLWLTNCLMPHPQLRMGGLSDEALQAECQNLCVTLNQTTGPTILISNEIGLGLIPMGAEVRRFVDELGRLHQRLAAQAHGVVLMVAGLPMRVK